MTPLFSRTILRSAVSTAIISAFSLAAIAASRSDDSVIVTTALSQRILKQDQTQTVFLRIGLKGRPAPSQRERTPVNVALVIDRSGSMAGQKIARAREAAKMAIERMDARDAAAVIAFDHRVTTLVPARRVRDLDYFRSLIDDITSGGRTAIYASVEAAARQLRKFHRAGQISRIILMSDGQANVGPRRPYQFAELGRRLGAEGISVTTIGLGRGYNEDLMAQLASASDGNHAFARTADDLREIFNSEFDDVLSVSAQDIEVIIETRDGVTPLRTLGRRGEIAGNHTRIKINQIYSNSEFSLQMALKVAADVAVDEIELAKVTVRYTAPDGTRRSVHATVRAEFSPDEERVANSLDPKVMEPILELEARERYEKVIQLRDKGRVKEASRLLEQNAQALEDGLRRYNIKSKRLRELSARSRVQSKAIASPKKWGSVRKQMRVDQSNRQGAKYKY